MKRRVPRLRTDEEAEAFLESDLSELDFLQFKSGRLRFKPGVQAAGSEGLAPSEAYRLFEQAMVERKQIVCMYEGRRQEVCPIILGHSQGEERALTYQFAGESSSRELPPEGDWRCLRLSNVSEIQLRNGPWHRGDGHKQPSGCIDIVDLDLNAKSPYNPKRRLADLVKTRAARRKGPRPRASGRKNPRSAAE